MKVTENGCAPPDRTDGGKAAQSDNNNRTRRRAAPPIAIAEALPAGTGRRQRPAVIVRECPYECGTPHVHYGPPSGTRGAGCLRNRRYRLVLPPAEGDVAA